MMHYTAKDSRLAIGGAMVQDSPQKGDTQFWKDIQRLFRKRRTRLQVVDHQSSSQVFIDRVEGFNKLSNPHCSPQIWRRGDNGHECEIRDEQCALGHGTFNSWGTINHDERIVIGELGDFAMDLVASGTQTDDRSREWRVLRGGGAFQV